MKPIGQVLGCISVGKFISSAHIYPKITDDENGDSIPFWLTGVTDFQVPAYNFGVRNDAIKYGAISPTLCNRADNKLIAKRIRFRYLRGSFS